jgi:hypothetical protein
MIYKKLLEFQKLNISIVKGSTNPHFKNNFANLNEVLSKVTKPLNDLGVVIIQTPGFHMENSGLRTTLYCVEDESEVTGFLPFTEATNPQKIGSNLTYYRRYSLVTMLGLEDADDDGNGASGVQALGGGPRFGKAEAVEDLPF